MAYGGLKYINGRHHRGTREEFLNIIFSLSMEMSRLARDGTAEPVSRDQILRRDRGQGNIHLPCSTSRIDNLTRLIHALAIKYVVVVVVDSVHTYIQRMVVVVVVFFTLTDRALTIPSNTRGCQSGTWSQRGTKVDGSHHGDSSLLRPTGIQIVTKSYATLHGMAPNNNETVHQISFTLYRE